MKRKIYHNARIDLDNATAELMSTNKKKDGKTETHFADAQIRYETVAPETLQVVKV